MAGTGPRRALLCAGAASAFVAVAAGAFGAHALRETLPPDRLQVFETAARYQMYHALALVGLAGIAASSNGGGAASSSSDVALRRIRTVGALFVLGTILFSGSLYALALSGVRVLGAITPFGGACWLTAWLILVVAAMRGDS